MEDVLSWLDAHTGAVQAISTTVLALITAVYVILTWRIQSAAKEQAQASRQMADEMHEQSLATWGPILLITVPRGGPLLGSGDGLARFPRGIHFALHNVGRGPALNGEVSFDNGYYQFEEAYRWIRIPAEGLYSKWVRLKPKGDMQLKGYPRTAAIVARYKDVFEENEYCSRLEIEIGVNGKAKAGKLSLGRIK